MSELNVSKRTMMRLIREHKDQIGVPIPQPNCKEVRFRKRRDGKYEMHWVIDGTLFRFIISAYVLMLWVHIYSDGHTDYCDGIPLDRDRLVSLGILNDREEGLECQG